jgi:hypothetical protein
MSRKRKVNRRDFMVSIHRGDAEVAKGLNFAFAGERPAKAKPSAVARQDLVGCPQGAVFFKPPPLTAVQKVSPLCVLRASSAAGGERNQVAVLRYAFGCNPASAAFEKGGGR